MVIFQSLCDSPRNTRFSKTNAIHIIVCVVDLGGKLDYLDGMTFDLKANTEVLHIIS